MPYRIRQIPEISLSPLFRFQSNKKYIKYEQKPQQQQQQQRQRPHTKLMSNDHRWVVKTISFVFVSHVFRTIDKRAWFWFTISNTVHVLITTSLVYGCCCCCCCRRRFFCCSFWSFCSFRSLSWYMWCVEKNVFFFRRYFFVKIEIGLKLEFHVGRATKYCVYSSFCFSCAVIFLD